MATRTHVLCAWAPTSLCVRTGNRGNQPRNCRHCLYLSL